MSSVASKDSLIADLDRVAQDTFAYFDGEGRRTTARVDQWQARDVLMHFIYFHNATAWGIQSAAQGGAPWPLPAGADHINDVCRKLHEHESIDELLGQLRLAHARLIRAARSASDIDTPAFKRPDGETVSVRQRLEVLARHWTEHVGELQAAAAKR